MAVVCMSLWLAVSPQTDIYSRFFLPLHKAVLVTCVQPYHFQSNGNTTSKQLAVI